MTIRDRKKRKKARKETIDCYRCRTQADCCSSGAWADLEEAKKILSLRLKGEFLQLEKDKDCPSGYRIGTSYNDNPCTFLDADGLCSIHKIDYNLKPKSCREFPYENNKVAPFAKYLCTPFMARLKRRKKLKKAG